MARTASASCATWGKRDIVTDMAIKLVPGGHPSHALAEAAANAARAGNIAPDEVDTIILSRPGVTALSGPIHPTDLIDMAHSPAYFVAAGVADRDFSWVHATEAGSRTRSSISSSIKSASARLPPNTSTLQTGGDRDHSDEGRPDLLEYRYAPKGAGVLGIDWADVDTKYRTLVPHARLSDRQVEDSLRMIHDFRDVTHVSALTDLLQVR